MAVETSTAQLITGEQLAAMMDMPPCELIDGEIVVMSPTGDEHGAYELNVGGELRDYIKAQQIGKARVGEVGIYIRRNPDTIRAADVIFISNERYAHRGKVAYLDVAPELVVEIMLPSDSFAEVQQKLSDYFAAGVQLIWVLVPDTRSVYAYRSVTDLRIFTANDLLPGDDLLPGFSVPVARLFEL